MNNRKRILLAVLAFGLLAGLNDLYDGWVFSRPPSEWKDVETDTYVASYPAQWDRTEHEQHPRLDRRHMAFESRPDLLKDDPFQRRLGVNDKGPRKISLDELVGEMRRYGESHTPIRDIRLDNGIVAKTWTHILSTVEIGIPVRWYVFEAPNGHVYTATHDVPQGWKHRWRYDRIFRRILGSMRFKADAASSTRRAGAWPPR